MKTIAVVLGIVLAILAIVYFLVPAGSLPAFFPGYEAGSAHVHVKHGIASAVLAVVLFVIAGFLGRR